VPKNCIDGEYFTLERRRLTLDLSAVALGIDAPISRLEEGYDFPLAVSWRRVGNILESWRGISWFLVFFLVVINVLDVRGGLW
jgi:hypothetical protein